MLFENGFLSNKAIDIETKRKHHKNSFIVADRLQYGSLSVYFCHACYSKDGA